MLGGFLGTTAATQLTPGGVYMRFRTVIWMGLLTLVLLGAGSGTSERRQANKGGRA